MQIITGTEEFFAQQDTAVAIGKFDGVHLGHKKLIGELLQQRKRGLLATIFTFDPSPEMYFGYASGKELSTRDEKRILFEQMGIDLLVEFPFNRKTAATPPETFVTDILAKRLRAKFIAAGPDLSFGDRGKGDFALLKSMAASCGYEARMIDKVQVGETVISSTLIRDFVSKGEMEKAAQCLGDPYTIRGTVVHGKALGRRIGFPTLNQVPPEEKLLPPHGVYFSRVTVDNNTYRGITNIGVKPTVTDENKITVETFLYDFSSDIYGEFAEVELLHYRRPELKFSGIDELEETMAKDIQAGTHYHDELKVQGRRF